MSGRFNGQSSQNVYKILDFARQKNLSSVRARCSSFLKEKTDSSNISELVEYLNQQNDPEYAQENLELRDITLKIILPNYLEISKDQNISPAFYEDFLIKNIAIDTVVGLANFIYGHNFKTDRTNSTISDLANFIYGDKFNTDRIGLTASDLKTLTKKERQNREPETLNLKPALLNFIQKNLIIISEKNLAEDLPNLLLFDLLLVNTEASKNHEKNLHLETQTSQ